MKWPIPLLLSALLAACGGTGAAHALANLHWQGFTVKDQQGNAVPFTSCSASGTDWATPK
jgi:hypothetical protein